MDRLANILKQRLTAQQSTASEHPSPDTLVAFVEHGLRADQQEHVLSHLGLCPECRQALVLAALEPVELEPTLSAVPSRVRTRFPAAMRWASGLAALAVAVGVGALFYQHPDKRTVPSSSEMVKTQAPEPSPSVASRVPQSLDAPVRQAPKIASNAGASATIAQLNRAGRSERLESKKAKSAGVPGGLVASSRADSEPAYMADTVSANHASTPQAQPEMAFGAKPTTPNAVPAPEVQSKLENPAPQGYLQANGASEMTELRRSGALNKSAVIGPARESQSAGAAMKAVATPALGGSIKPHAAFAESFARWTISTNGKLQRVSQNGGSSLVEPAPALTVRAVAAQGIEVWAGGSEPDLSAAQWQQRPALFHSSDAGETWTRIDGPWQGAIQSLALLNLHSLTVVTGDGRWTTTDAGKTWSRR